MSDFVRDLERELRAASTRRTRLAIARLPRPNMTAAALTLSIAICAVVVIAVLHGHSSQPQQPAARSTLTTANQATNTRPRPSPPQHQNAVITDCMKHARLTGHYTTAQLHHALNAMTAAQRQYTACVKAIQHVLVIQSTQSRSPEHRTHDLVIADCIRHGRLTKHYSTAQLHHALTVMPAAERRYTPCVRVIRRALQGP
jgi:hypothetical protein